MFTYCVERLNCSEGEAYRRIHAARAARKFPLIFELIASGTLHLSGVNVLAPELTQENHRALLDQARGRSKRAIEELVRARAPKPDAPPLIRKLPGPRQAEPAKIASALPDVPAAPPNAPPPPLRPPVVAPLAEDRFKLQVTVSRALKEKIETAKALLRHQIPNGDLERVLEHAVDELLTALMKKKFAVTSKPKPQSTPADHASRSIPAAVKREVAVRDELRCTFVSADAHRCTERAFLEMDHRRPYAKGGRSTADNVRLHCRAHNSHQAELAFGREFMRRKKQLIPG